MSRNYYSEINLHLVWHTKDSLPLLTPAVEPIAQRCLTKRIVDWPGAYVHAIGGIETHIHIVVTVPPTPIGAHHERGVKRPVNGPLKSIGAAPQPRHKCRG